MRYYRVLAKHRRGCRAMLHYRDGGWSSPWSGVVERTAYLDTLGRRIRHGMRAWFVISCNDPDCSAKLLVSAEGVLDLLERVSDGDYSAG